MRIRPTDLTTKILKTIINTLPISFANISGDNGIIGTVCFYPFLKGVIMIYEINHLPENKSIFAFHIHEGDSCTNPMTHYNPTNHAHPYHLGDLPPIFSTHSLAWSMVYIDKLNAFDMIGKTIIIHENVDDFVSQPSGNPGRIIACGQIQNFHLMSE